MSAVHGHDTLTFHGYSGSDFTLANLQAVLGEGGGEHDDALLVKKMPQFETVDSVWEHMQHYIDLSGCKDIKPLAGLLVGRPRMVAKVLTDLASSINHFMASVISAFNPPSGRRNAPAQEYSAIRAGETARVRIVRSNGCAVGSPTVQFCPDGYDEQILLTSPVDIEHDEVIITIHEQDLEIRADGSYSAALKPAALAAAVRFVWIDFVRSLVTEIKKMDGEFLQSRNAGERDMV